jgi:hypothetical protein
VDFYAVAYQNGHGQGCLIKAIRSARLPTPLLVNIVTKLALKKARGLGVERLGVLIVRVMEDVGTA